MSRIGAIVRWSTWAGALSSRHRRLTARTAGLNAVLAKPRAAGRTVREHWTHATRTLQPQIHLSIQPLLRFDLQPAAAASQVLHQTLPASQSDLRPAAAASRMLQQVLHTTERSRSEAQRIVERFRQIDSSSTTRVLEAVSSHQVPETPRIAPLSLVLQRLREPERALIVQTQRWFREGPASRPEIARQLADRLASKVRREEKPIDTPAARVLREDAPVSRNDRDPAGVDRGFPTLPSHMAPDPWREAPMAASVSTAAAPATAAMISPAGVEALTEKVMHQIDQRLHAWRERRGGF